MSLNNHPGLEVDVVVAIQLDQSSLTVLVDPWDSCPSEEARGEGWQCQENAFDEVDQQHLEQIMSWLARFDPAPVVWAPPAH